MLIVATAALFVVLITGLGVPALADASQSVSSGPVSSVIRTYAGGPGEGPPLSVAQQPQGVAVRGGKLYVADVRSKVVRVVDESRGHEGIFAGGGGAFAEGGPATAAQMRLPIRVTFSPSGDAYVVDNEAGAVLKVDTTGRMTTVAKGLTDPEGIAVDRDGNIYVAEGLGYRVVRISPSGDKTTVAGNGTPGFLGDGGPATQAQLNRPSGVAVDTNGDLYIADTANHRIRLVSATAAADGTRHISTVAGVGPPDPPGRQCYGCGGGSLGDGGPALLAQLRLPIDVAIDGDGLLIADMENHRIRRVGPAAGALGLRPITTIAGNGTSGFDGDGGRAIQANLNRPVSVAVDELGEVYVADRGNNRVRRIDSDGIISTVAGNGFVGWGGDGRAASTAQLYVPQGIHFDQADNLYIADSANERIRMVDRTGTMTTIAGSGRNGFGGDEGPALQAEFASPVDVASAPDGTLYVVDHSNQRIRKMVQAADGTWRITTVAGTGVAGYSGDGGPARLAVLNSPRAVVADAAGNVYFSDTGNHRVRRIDASGTITTIAGIGEAGSAGDGGDAAAAQLNGPWGLELDGAGNLYIAEFGGHRVRMVEDVAAPGGPRSIRTVAGTGSPGAGGDGDQAVSAQLRHPSGLAVDPAGALLIADTGNAAVRRIEGNGTISRFAGSGTSGYSGDGGPAQEASFFFNLGIAVDGAGHLYVADSGNDRVRQVHTCGDQDPPAQGQPC